MSLSRPKTYNIRTWGCQMNEADSQRLASELERFGLKYTDNADQADVIVLNTCVVRQNAEDRVYGRLGQLRVIKQQYPDKIIGLMGCLVGIKEPLPLQQRFPFVDVFMAPSDLSRMALFLERRGLEREIGVLERQARQFRDAAQDGDLILPLRERGQLVSAYVPVVYGCSHACSFCVIPYRRGIERSRSVGEIADESRTLANQGVKEITLLGQIVDRYGKDIPDGPGLADLLRVVHDIEGVERIRFLTSHPNWMTDKLLDTVMELPKVCEHIEVPIQAGDDQVLQRMKRGYTQAEYRRLIERIRRRFPEVAIHTDIIVGFPGESDDQFQHTYDLLEQLRLDKVHVAMYSPRPNTLSARSLPDDIPAAEKKRRLQAIEDLQAGIATDINRRYVGQQVEVLVEDQHHCKWRGRTRLDKLVFFEDAADWRGKLVNVEVTWSGPWSMQGCLRGAHTPSRMEMPIASVGQSHH